MYKPEKYTIYVRLETIENEDYFVGRVAEWPDVEEYASSYSCVIELVLDTIKTTQKILTNDGIPFPAPFSNIKVINDDNS